MSGNFRQNLKDRMNKTLLDSENYHNTLQHGADIKEIYLNRYGFSSLDQFLAWFNKPIDYNFDHVQGRALEVLMIAEKDTMAHEVVKNLSVNNNYHMKRIPMSRINDNVLVKGYQFTRNMFGKHANIWMTSTFGHLNGQTFPSAVDEHVSEEILYAKIIDVSCNKKVSFAGELSKKLGKNCDAVILLLDNDEEGEAITFEVIDYLKDYINMPPSGNFMDAFYRASFSSAPEIVDAIQCLGRPDLRILLSMVAKHYLDLRSGVALSRCQKFIAQHFLPNYRIPRLSFRPCGSIAVKIIADIYDEVNARQSVPKYCLEFTLDVDGLKFVFSSGDYDKDEAEIMHEKLKGIQQGEVTQASTSAPIIEKSPPGLNYFELMRFLSKFFKIDSTETAHIAQLLYELGYISYPRTETSKYPACLKVNANILHENFSLMDSKNAFPSELDDKTSLSSDQNDEKFLKTIRNMKTDVQSVLHKGEDKKDQPPITPTQKQWYKDDRLTDRENLVYKFIVRRFLASFLGDYKFCKETTEFQIGKSIFEYSSFKTLSSGFTTLLPELIKVGTTGDEKLVFDVGHKFTVADIQIKELPRPSYLEEYQLIQLMEDFNIGTDGSVSKHIESIERRGFVKIDIKTFELIPLPLGSSMTNGYRECIPELVDPKFRAKFIRKIRDIAIGKREFVDVYDEGLKRIDENYQELSKNFYVFFGKHLDEFKKCFSPDRYRPVIESRQKDESAKIYWR